MPNMSEMTPEERKAWLAKNRESMVQPDEASFNDKYIRGPLLGLIGAKDPEAEAREERNKSKKSAFGHYMDERYK